MSQETQSDSYKHSYVSVCCVDNINLCIDLQDKSKRESTYAKLS